VSFWDYVQLFVAVVIMETAIAAAKAIWRGFRRPSHIPLDPSALSHLINAEVETIMLPASLATSEVRMLQDYWDQKLATRFAFRVVFQRRDFV
jgi:hypothetical protein